jgi:hypothetical protein
MHGGRRQSTPLFCPMISAGLGRILTEASLSRTFVLRMQPYDEETKPKFEWLAPGNEGDEDSEKARKDWLDACYKYLRHWSVTREFDLRPQMPVGVIRRNADNCRSLLSVAEMCSGGWPRRLREALVALDRDTTDDQPQTILLRHGLLLFERLDADMLEIGLFNRELHRLSEPEFDWNRYCSPTGINRSEHPITISEQGRLLSPKVKSHPTWPRGVPPAQRKPGDCKRVFKRSEFEAALRPPGAARLRQLAE